MLRVVSVTCRHGSDVDLAFSYCSLSLAGHIQCKPSVLTLLTTAGACLWLEARHGHRF